ncbi:13685_t:CDS:1, partial [Cetraspora pellucida]
ISLKIVEKPEDRKLISKIQKNRKNSPTTQLNLPESQNTRGDHKKFYQKSSKDLKTMKISKIQKYRKKTNNKIAGKPEDQGRPQEISTEITKNLKDNELPS